ncbi:hypothetical protein Tco_0808780 [Tanacetum coccineum]
MREFAANDQADYYSGITSIMENGKNAYELKGKFLDDFHKNAFSRTHGEDAVEHIEYFLNIGIGYRQKDKKRSQIGQNRARIWKELKKSKVKAKFNPDKVKSKPKSTPTKSKSKEKSKQSQNTTLGTEFAKSLELDFKDLKTKVGWRRWDGYEISDHDQEEREYENEDKERCELFDDHEFAVCTIRRFEMIFIRTRRRDLDGKEIDEVGKVSII